MNDETRQVPVDWEEEMARQAKAMSALERPQVANISLRSGMLSYQGTALPDNKLNCVIIAAIFERTWYTVKFDPNAIRPPACFAQSLDGDKMQPHEIVPNPPSEWCESCPNDEWGSEEGRRGKKCKETRKLAVLPFMKDGKYENAEIAVMRVPVMSVIAPGTGWSAYVNKIAAIVKRPYYAVATEITVKPDMKSQFKVHFELAGKLSAEEAGKVYARREQAEQILLTPYDMTQPESGAQSDKY